MITPEVKEIIEHNPVVLATCTPEGKPNAIAVAGVQVVDEHTLLVTDVFMNQTLKDIKNNSTMTLLAWNKDMNGYKMLGKARYFDNGAWLDKVKLLPDNKDLKPKGALLISVVKIFKTA